MEGVLEHPRLCAVAVDNRVTLFADLFISLLPLVGILDTGVHLTILVLTDEEPDTGHEMTGVDDIQDKSSEGCQIVLALLRILLEGTAQEELQWLCQSINVHKSEAFQNVPLE